MPRAVRFGDGMRNTDSSIWALGSMPVECHSYAVWEDQSVQAAAAGRTWPKCAVCLLKRSRSTRYAAVDAVCAKRRAFTPWVQLWKRIPATYRKCSYTPSTMHAEIDVGFGQS
jgi:hypothetical protein